MDPKRKWRAKDAAIYLVSALAVRASVAAVNLDLITITIQNHNMILI